MYLAVSTGGGQRSQLAERQATVATRSAQLQQVSPTGAQSAQAKLTLEIRNAAEMHAAQTIRKMEAASAAKKAVAPARAMSPAVEKQQAYNMPETHHGVTGAQRAMEQREEAAEERENEGSTESVLPEHSRTFAPRMVQQQVISLPPWRQHRVKS